MTAQLWSTFTTFALGGFFGLVVIINPPATVPFFTALTARQSEADSALTARRACIYCFAILLSSLFAGSLILKAFGISYGALRISGGLVLALLGYGMLFGRGSGAHLAPEGEHGNLAFFPLAMPGITGPGTIAVVIGISTEIRELEGASFEAIAYLATVVAMLAACVLELLVLRSARRISARMGPAGIEVMTRMMGFLLVCVGVQFIASGVRSFVAEI
ncbi:MAG: MarC family NAAT transporter [Burkholderiaceae bacterium]|nr:MarC family NAAT transporter [Burkholderiaceae bacterium]